MTQTHEVSVGAAILGGMSLARLPESRRLVGIVTAAELVAAGISRTSIRSFVRRGDLLAVGRGVFARGDSAAQLIVDDPCGERLLWLAAALAITGPGAVGSHQDAAIVHGLALLDRPPAGCVTMSRPPGAPGSRTGRAGVRLHIATLQPCDVTVCRGVPVTSVARTVIDLARTMPFRAGEVVADSALFNDLTSAAELSDVIRECRRWPGIERARQVVGFAHPQAESPFESISRVAFRDGGLPPPVLQAWIMRGGRAIGRVDFLWEEHRTIAEADGAAKYADPGVARKQLRRDAELREAGFEVVHFTWRDLTTTPDQVIGSIRAAFGRGGLAGALDRSGALADRSTAGRSTAGRSTAGRRSSG